MLISPDFSCRLEPVEILKEPDDLFASPVDNAMLPDGPKELGVVTSGLSITIPPDKDDSLDPDWK
jgi:hypothetical protein